MILKKGFSAVLETAKGNEALSESLMAFLLNLGLKGFFFGHPFALKRCILCR